MRLDRFVVPVERPGLPPQGLTILHLSDLHLRAGGAVQAANWFHRGRTHMFVSRGVGESFQVRFGAPPQAALIRLIPTGKQGAS